MLVVHGITKRYGHQTILEDVSFTVNRGDRVGLIGPNGCGKTTLLRIICGHERPDDGGVSFQPKGLRIGYLPQGLQVPEDTRLVDLLDPRRRELQQAEVKLARISDQVARAEGDQVEALMEAYDRTLDSLTSLSLQVSEGHIENVLATLGLQDLGLSTPVHELSGGQKTRLSLAKILLGDAQLLLLDEPTNHLDIEMLEWLEGWLARFEGGVLIVSHDRTFLDQTVRLILDLDETTHRIRAYEGNYSVFLATYLTEREKQMAAYRDQVYEIRRVRQDIARTKEQASKIDRSTIDDQQRRYAKKVARKAKSREKKLARYLKSEDRVEKPREGWRMKLEFTKPKHRGRDVLIIEDLAIGYSGFEPLISGLNLHLRAGGRVALTGANGSGKTTLLRTIAGHLDPFTGRVRLGPSVQLGYMAQEQELLDPDRNALALIREAAPMSETEARAFLHAYLFSGDDPLRPVSSLSYGERARLMLALLVAGGSNFLLLDEPINHLDIPSRSRFEAALSRYDGTVIAVVHDRYFIQGYATELWVVEDKGVRVVL
ncbi:MAG TPA: ABC-F family ATP-binding cassette domain-containing protein [Anaerolineae bacterium]|nr:ABC-F family ATP-binding cassette domain-containing protein [Anaerolineae bacterium]